MTNIDAWVRVAIATDDGQTMAEYGLILAGVFVIVAAALVLLGDPVHGLLQAVIAAFP